MAADTGLLAVSAHNHGQSVPARQAPDTPLDFPVAGIHRLLLRRNGIEVRRVGGESDSNPRLLSVVTQFGEESVYALGSAMPDDISERIQPFPSFDLVKVRSLSANDFLHCCRSQSGG